MPSTTRPPRTRKSRSGATSRADPATTAKATEGPTMRYTRVTSRLPRHRQDGRERRWRRSRPSCRCRGSRDVTRVYRIVGPSVAFAVVAGSALLVAPERDFRVRGGLVVLGIYMLALQLALAGLVLFSIDDFGDKPARRARTF